MISGDNATVAGDVKEIDQRPSGRFFCRCFAARLA